MKRSCVALMAFAAACGGSPKPAADTTAATVESPPPKPAEKTADTAPPKDGATKGAQKWAAFPGPNAPPAKGAQLWVVAPIQNSDWASSVGLFRADVARSEPNAAVVKGVKDEDVFVPGALTHAETSASYKKGEPVLFASNAGLISGGSFGRVANVTKSGDDTTVSVKYAFGDDISSDDVTDASTLLPLDGKLAFGAPAAFKDGDKWTTAIYVGPGSDAGKSWMIEFAGKIAQHANVKPLSVTKIFKKGDPAWAARFADLEPVTITDVVDGGVQYKIKTKSGEQATVSFTQVTSPL